MAFTCTICADSRDDSAKRTTPCCQQDICQFCIADSTEAMVRYQGDRFYCSLCHDEVTDPDSYALLLPPDSVTAMKSARSNLVPVGQNAVTVDDGTLRSNAWQFGAYTHSPGCGSAVSVIDGCDTLKCPTCGAQINIAGGQPGVHTYHVEGFFREAQTFSGQTAASQLEILRDKYRDVWDARFLTELTDGIRAGGTMAGWIDSMADYAWGGFRDFLRQRIAPNTQGPDQTSLFALINSIGAGSADGQLLSGHYYAVEEPRKMTELDTMQARRKLVSEITDGQVKAIVRAKLGAASWWRS